ncbi:MAG TPA: hypothetical protein VG847_04945 [Chitinophagaceae bacterium]|nr:hypothetical protein [Chitinophagaceae bacterium]
MKHIKLIVAVFTSISFLFFSCNGNSNANSSKQNGDNNTSTSNTSSIPGDGGSFSYKIDGKEISGSGQDQFGFTNCITFHSKDTIDFTLADQSGKSAVTPQFSFMIAANGTTKITQDDIERKHSGNNITYYAEFTSYQPDKIPNYSFHSGITVIITSNNGSRITGTFSGELIDNNNNLDKVVQLTDGKFDLPVCSHPK